MKPTAEHERAEALARLAAVDEHLSTAVRESTRQRALIQEARTRLRLGEPVSVAMARLLAACPELGQEVER